MIPQQAPPRWRVPLALAVVYVVWGSTYLALRWVVEVLPPLISAGTRYLLAGFGLVAVARASGAALPTRLQLWRALPVGVLLFVVGNGFVAVAETEVPSSRAAIVCGAMPLVAVVLGRLAGERVRRVELVGLLVGFVGVAVMTTLGAGADAGDTHAPFKETLLLFAPLGWALGSRLSRGVSCEDPLVRAALPMLGGGASALALGLVSGESVAIEQLTTRAVLAFFYLVVFGSMIAFTAYTYLLRHARQSVATSYAYVNPALATLLGVLVAGEPLSAPIALGAALVVLGVFVVIAGRGRALSPRGSIGSDPRDGDDPVERLASRPQAARLKGSWD